MESGYYARDIRELISHDADDCNPFDVAYIAYLFCKILATDDPRLDSPRPIAEVAERQFERFTSGEISLSPFIRPGLTHRLGHNFVRAYPVLKQHQNSRIFATVITSEMYSSNNTTESKAVRGLATPDSIVKLAHALLNIQPNDKVADICCGTGNFLTTSFRKEQPHADYYGYEINVNCAAVLAMKADIVGFAPHISVGDIEYTLADSTLQFDKIFSDHPLGVRLSDYERRIHHLLFRASRASSDWYFNQIVVDHLAKNGKAVAISTLGSTWNQAGEEARKYFVDHGLIETVINLPGGLLPSTSVPAVIYVFSHDNQKVRFINAEGFIKPDRYYSDDIGTLSEKQIQSIVELLTKDSEYSLSASTDEIVTHGYSLAFRTYRSGLPHYSNGRTLSSVAQIFRGTLNPKGLTPDQPTNHYLLQLSDLNFGSVDKNLDPSRCVSPSAATFAKSLQPGDLIISRSAQPVKVAIVAPDESRTLYPSDNMFVIRLKNQKVDPYYLLSFLLSREGQDALEFATTGSSLRTISATSLSELIFPLASPADQRAVADRLSAAIAAHSAYALKLELTKNDIENSYYAEGED